MRIPRIYCSTKLETKKTFTLDEEASRHVGLVLRLSRHDHIILFNGDGFDYLAEITNFQTRNKKSVMAEVTILEKKSVDTKPTLHIHLFQAISKPEKIEWVVQKSVELGVTDITLINTQYCSVKPKNIKIERLEKIILSACEQSGRADIPSLHPIKSTLELFNNEPDLFQNSTNLLFTPEGKNHLHKIKHHKQNINIFIGPEGGFSEEEVALSEQENFFTVNLGKRILRTETAPLCALSACQTLWGDFV